MTMTEARHVRDMSPEEAAETLRALKRGPPPTPIDTGGKKARDMSEIERQEYLAEHRRRFG
jgi:ribosomal protein L29